MNTNESRRQRCREQTIAIQTSSFTPVKLVPGMIVEHHANCVLVDDVCEFELCEIVEQDVRKNGWYQAKFHGKEISLIHAQECILPISEVE